LALLLLIFARFSPKNQAPSILINGGGKEKKKENGSPMLWSYLRGRCYLLDALPGYLLRL
jgi:hypothetical protein